MPLLSEYAITPDVFLETSHENEVACKLRLQHLKDALLQDGLVRDLRAGEWAKTILEGPVPPHVMGKELVKVMKKRSRLTSASPSRPTVPMKDEEWCDEALATMTALSLQGIIVSSATGASRKVEPVVGIEKLAVTPWWTSRSPSMRLQRTAAQFLNALAPVLRHANSIMWIDPHMDPSLPRYTVLEAMLNAIGNRRPAPVLEMHRICSIGSGRTITFPTEAEWRTKFDTALGPTVRAKGLRLKVHVWDDFHDRYLISNLIGLTVPFGFDTTAAPNAITTWTRLGAPDAEDVQREFDIASGRHQLRHLIEIA